jgi:hypothetical protein
MLNRAVFGKIRIDLDLEQAKFVESKNVRDEMQIAKLNDVISYCFLTRFRWSLVNIDLCGDMTQSIDIWFSFVDLLKQLFCIVFIKILKNIILLK